MYAVSQLFRRVFMLFERPSRIVIYIFHDDRTIIYRTRQEISQMKLNKSLLNYNQGNA